MIVSYLTHPTSTATPRQQDHAISLKDDQSKWIVPVAEVLLLPIFALVFGFVVHLFVKG